MICVLTTITADFRVVLGPFALQIFELENEGAKTLVLSNTAAALQYLELNSTNSVRFYILYNSDYYLQNPFCSEIFLLVSFKFMKLKEGN